MYKTTAVFIGMLIAIMLFFNGSLNLFLDSFASGVLIHTVGLIAVIGILLWRREERRINSKIPKYLMTGGLYGVFLVIFNNYSYIKIGATLTLTLGLFGQMIFSSIVDHYGLFGMKEVKMNPQKMIGFGIVSAGVLMMTLA